MQLGIDVSKFSADQQRALKKIAEFEAQAKRSAGGARDQIKTVGAAFRDLAKDSRLGTSAGHVENLAEKIKTLGLSMGAAGGAGAPLGMMARGLGALLSPAALGAAAIGLVAKEAWDLNKVMTDVNATINRQAQLSGMNAKNLWAWGEAAKTVGGNPQDVTGGIAAVQKSIAGMMVGAGDATPQLVALARLGLHWNAQSGLTDAQVTQMFTKVHQLAAAKGYKNLGALRSLTDPIMNDAMFNIATDREFDPAKLKKQIADSAPKNLNEIFQKSLKSQMELGKLDIDKDILAQTAYGGEQGLMMSVVEILRSLLGVVTRVADFLMNPKKAYDAAVDYTSRTIIPSIPEVGKLLKNLVSPSASAMRRKEYKAMQFFMDNGYAKDDAAAIVGSLAQESSMNPLASNKGHVGYAQWDKERQADFAKRFGYQIGSSAVPKDQQENDQLQFILYELQHKRAKTLSDMQRVKDLMSKTKVFMDQYEVPKDNSLSARYFNAQDAMRLAEGMVSAAATKSSAVQHNISSETQIGDVHIHTPATDPKSHAEAFRKGLSDNPLMSEAAMSSLTLATRGTTQ